MGANSERAIASPLTTKSGTVGDTENASKRPLKPTTTTTIPMTSKSAPSALHDRTNRPPQSPLAATFSPDGQLSIKSRSTAIIEELKAALREALGENRQLHDALQQAQGQDQRLRAELSELRVMRVLYEQSKEDRITVMQCDQGVSCSDEELPNVDRAVETTDM